MASNKEPKRNGSVPKSDFHEEALTIKQHSENIADLEKRVAEVERKLGSPDQIACLLETASSDSKKIDKVFATVFTSMLKDEKGNPDVREAFTKFVDEHDRKITNTVLKKWGGYLSSGLILILGMVSQILIEWAKRKLGL